MGGAEPGGRMPESGVETISLSFAGLSKLASSCRALSTRKTKAHNTSKTVPEPIMIAAQVAGQIRSGFSGKSPAAVARRPLRIELSPLMFLFGVPDSGIGGTAGGSGGDDAGEAGGAGADR